MNIRHSKLASGIVISALLLSGCSSISDFTSSSNVSNDNDKYNDNQATLSDVVKQMQEWEELKPGLIRLIKQESELSFLLSELENMSNVQTFANDYVDISGRSLTGQPNVSMQPPELRALAKSSEANPEQSQEVEVASARPIQRNLTSSNKFSSQSAPVSSSVNRNQIVGYASTSSPNNAQPTTFKSNANIAQRLSNNSTQEQGASISKFQETSVANLVGSTDECSVNLNSVGDNAIHLVSYKSKNYVEKGWQELMSKHKEVLCGKQPLVASVTVKGIDYQSLRVGPYINVAEAQSACKKLRDSGQYCAVTKFTGKNIEQL
mmetsp:Transcript_49740/g.158864  ORF Transcript_49740/g.158864 Transcript_49740/m.158864 type:complete len:321 (-) Transcript_49740:1344-2306(-)